MKIGILSRSLNIYSTHRLYEAAKQRGHEVQVIDHTKCSVMIEQSNPPCITTGTGRKRLKPSFPESGASVTFLERPWCGSLRY